MIHMFNLKQAFSIFQLHKRLITKIQSCRLCQDRLVVMVEAPDDLGFLNNCLNHASSALCKGSVCQTSVLPPKNTRLSEVCLKLILGCVI